MKKQELVHLHGLLSEVEHHYEEREGVSVESDEYLDLGVRPTSIHRAKKDQKDAVLALAGGIVQEMEEPGSTAYDLESRYERLLEDVEDTGSTTLRERETSLNSMEMKLLGRSEEYPVTYKEAGFHTSPRIKVDDEEFLEENSDQDISF